MGSDALTPMIFADWCKGRNVKTTGRVRPDDQGFATQKTFYDVHFIPVAYSLPGPVTEVNFTTRPPIPPVT